MKELYINGILCDLNESDTPIVLSYEVNDLAELKDRQAFSSGTIKLPNTINNRKACGFPETGSIIGLQPYRKNVAKIVQDGIEIMPNGIAIINSYSGDIEVQVLSGIIGFFDAIDSKSIRDLNLDDQEHTWDLVTVANSQSKTDGYIYPVIDYGSLSEADKNIDVRQLRPGTFRKTIIERIVSEAGFTMSGVILSDPRYARSVLPFSVDKFEHGESFKEIINTYKTSARNTVNQPINTSNMTEVIVFQDDATTDPTGAWSGTVYTQGATRFRATVTLKYGISQIWNFPFGSPGANIMRIQKLSGGVWTSVADNVTTSTTRFVIEEFRDQIVTVVLDLLPGDQVRVLNEQRPTTNRTITTVLAGSSIDIAPIAEDVIYGQLVQLEATLPKISQKDFFKDFLQNFGLIVIPDFYKRHITLVNMGEIYANKYRAKDWTMKFVDRVQTIDYSFGSYGINNVGQYKEDEAVPDATGEGVLVFDNQTLKEDVDLFTSQFAASISAVKLGGINVAQIVKIEKPLESLDFKVKTEPRILMDEKVGVNVFFIDGTDSVGAITISLPYFQQTGKLGLGYDELFDNYYDEILRMLYRPFVVSAYIMLNAVDIQQLDFTIPIFDAKSGAYYYNNGITNYVSGSEAKISLVKMP